MHAAATSIMLIFVEKAVMINVGLGHEQAIDLAFSGHEPAVENLSLGTSVLLV